VDYGSITSMVNGNGMVKAKKSESIRELRGLKQLTGVGRRQRQRRNILVGRIELLLIALYVPQYYSYAYQSELYAGQTVQVSVPALMATVEGTVEKVHMVKRVTSEGSELFPAETER